MARFLGLLAAALACSRAHGLDDAVALHQKRPVERPTEGSLATAQAPGAAGPSFQERLQAQSVVSLAIGKGIDRFLELFNLQQHAPADVRWQALSVISEWAMDRYSRPKSPAHHALLNGIIDLFGKAFISGRDDAEVLAKLADVDRLHSLARKFAEQTNAPEVALQVIDGTKRVLDAERRNGTLSLNSVPRILEEVLEPFRGQPLADMLLYANSVGQSHSKVDEAKLHNLLSRVAGQFRLPTAAADTLEHVVEKVEHAVDDARRRNGQFDLSKTVRYMLELQPH